MLSPRHGHRPQAGTQGRVSLLLRLQAGSTAQGRQAGQGGRHAAGKRRAGALWQGLLCGLLGRPVSQPLMWAGGGRLGAPGRPSGACGWRPRLADGVQSVGQGLQLILDAVQGAPDGAGTVQHVDGQRVRVKLHREGALDAGGVVPAGGEGDSRQGPSVTSGVGLEGGSPSPPSQRVQRPQDFSEPLGPPKLVPSSHPDKSGDQDVLQGLGSIYGGEDRPFPSKPLPGTPSGPAPSQGRHSQASSSRKASRHALWRVYYVPVPKLARESRSPCTPGSVDPGPQFPS